MIACRTASRAEIGTLLDWAAAEGWNPGTEDAAAFQAADPDGFFVAADDSGPVAGISVVNHSPGFAFLGLYIVRPDRRGAGIGLRLWSHAVAHAGARTIGLDGVPAQQANYARSGFVMAGQTTRYTGPVPARPDAQARPSTAADLPRLIAAEAAASGVRKPAYLSAWLSANAQRQTFMLETGAFCTARACRTGTKIGPLIADTPEQARRLLHHSASLFPGPLCIDVPQSAKALHTLCRDLGLVAGFETARMYRGTAPRSGHPLFAVTTLELG